MKPQLSICSVSYLHSKHLLANIALTKNLNPSISLQWLIVNNSPEKDSLECIIRDHSDFTIVVDGPPNSFNDPGKNSKHHAVALNLIVKHAKTRFLLILDPDFYIIMPNWVNCIIPHMIKENFGLFGIPWHPRWRSKYRYFPCIHCLFVDTAYVKISDLNFLPDFIEQHSLPLLRRFFMKIPLLNSRALVAQSRDTGYRIYNTYHDSQKVKNGIIVPSFSRKDLYNMYYRTNRALINLWFWLNSGIDKLFPDSMSIFPKEKKYHTEISFTDMGLPDCKSFGWEEFFFNNRPFGFHVRGFQQNHSCRQNEIEKISKIIDMFKHIIAES